MKKATVFLQKLFRTRVYYLLYLLFYSFLLSVWYRKMGSFGCFDDCFNYMGGFFLLKGKILYEQIFYNHQPLAAFISAAVQYFGKPETIYQLIFFHRIFVFVFSLLFGLLILRKFGAMGFVFLLFYESTKYYFFGDRFLAEGLIVYPIVYLFGLVLTGLHKKQFDGVDLIVGTFSVWFTFWMREPYAPLVLALYIGFLFFLRKKNLRIISLASVILCSFALFSFFPFSDYYFNVITLNASSHLQHPFSFRDMFSAFFYPIEILFSGRNTPLRLYEMVLAAVFLLLFLVGLRKRQNVKFLFVIFLILGLANLRPGPPGVAFYEAFHMLNWYALFLLSISFLLFFLKNQLSSWLFRVGAGVMFLALLIFLAFPRSYLREKTDSAALFYEGYNQYYTTGEVVRLLSTPDQTLFLDGWNDLIYWQAQRTSSYQYSWYTSVMPQFTRYTRARASLLSTNPPDFFYGACREWPVSRVSKAFLGSYRRFSLNGTPTCLYARIEAVEKISPSQRAAVAKLGYTLPE